MERSMILGNEAIALGLVEQGCQIVTAYPGTPSSEILAGVVKHKQRLKRDVYTEWSANEKVAFEVALAASWTGLRAAVAMKQVGLNVAADPLFSAAYIGVKGGFVIIPADDPGPQSSQTEQDSRLMALNAKVPVLDPSTPEEAHSMVAAALELSERYEVPVMLRPTTRLCHALQSLPVAETLALPERPKTRFRKDPARWAATPKFRYLLHKELNKKLQDIEAEFAASPLNYLVAAEAPGSLGIIASGVAFHTAQQALGELQAEVPILKIGTPYPLPQSLVNDFIDRFEHVMIIEEPDACIELQVSSRDKVHGRLDGSVPAAGELTPEVVFATLSPFLDRGGFATQSPPGDEALQQLVGELPLPIPRPRLCPGCSHRSAFFSLKRSFGPGTIYPGDIGCYTLGANLRAVDTIVDMGSSVSMATGFFQAAQFVDDASPIVATIGDFTFLHSGIPPLINAVHTGARFVLIILDNHTTAMTGFQPTAQSDHLADGSLATQRVSIEGLVRACGVGYMAVADPYDQDAFAQLLKEAHDHSQAPEGGVAVVIADRPCALYDPAPVAENPIPVLITDECDGCRYCLEVFECPALVLSVDGSRVDVNQDICIDCGQCVDACYKGFILPAIN